MVTRTSKVNICGSFLEVFLHAQSVIKCAQTKFQADINRNLKGMKSEKCRFMTMCCNTG